MQIRVSGTYPELKKAMEYTQAGAEQGYADLKKYLFRKYETEPVTAKRKIKANYQMVKGNEPKLAGKEKMVKTNPFAMKMPKKKRKGMVSKTTGKDLLTSEETKNVIIK